MSERIRPVKYICFGIFYSGERKPKKVKHVKFPSRHNIGHSHGVKNNDL